MLVYGIDVGVRNLAIVTMRADTDSLEMERTTLIDLGRGKLVFKPFIDFHSQHMLESGHVRIEFQHRQGKSQSTSYFLLGYLTAMGHTVQFAQPKGKFTLAHRLNMVNKLPTNSTYSARKKHAIKVLHYVCRQLNYAIPKLDKLDDIADATCYAMWTANELYPQCTKILDNRRGVVHLNLVDECKDGVNEDDDLDLTLSKLLSSNQGKDWGTCESSAAPSKTSPENPPIQNSLKDFQNSQAAQ